MTLNWQDSDALVHVKNTRHFETMKDPSRKDGFEEIQRLAQHWKSTLRIMENAVEMKFKSTPYRTMDLNPGL